jgi:hypothetical protein
MPTTAQTPTTDPSTPPAIDPSPSRNVLSRVVRAMATCSLHEWPDVVAGDVSRVQTLAGLARPDHVSRAIDDLVRLGVLTKLWPAQVVRRRRSRFRRDGWRDVRKGRIGLYAWVVPPEVALETIRARRATANARNVRARWERIRLGVGLSSSSLHPSLLEELRTIRTIRTIRKKRERVIGQPQVVSRRAEAALARQRLRARIDECVADACASLGVPPPEARARGRRKRLPESVARKFARRLAEGYEPGDLVRWADPDDHSEEWLRRKGAAVLLRVWGVAGYLNADHGELTSKSRPRDARRGPPRRAGGAHRRPTRDG